MSEIETEDTSITDCNQTENDEAKVVPTQDTLEEATTSNDESVKTNTDTISNLQNDSRQHENDSVQSSQNELMQGNNTNPTIPKDEPNLTTTVMTETMTPVTTPTTTMPSMLATTMTTPTITAMPTTSKPVIQESKNKSNESTNNQESNEYAEHITYTEDGEAIYIDPKTQYKYKWSTKENSWIYFQSENNGINSNNINAAAAAETDNPYETEHYRWCHERNQWISKVVNKPNENCRLETAQTETEFYKWDAAKNAWILKIQNQQPTEAKTTTAATTEAVETSSSLATAQATHATAVTYGIDEDGQRIYTDKDGAVFFWDPDKSAWFPKIDDDFMARYQMNYGFIDNTSASEEERKLREESENKRKEAELNRMTEEARAAATAMATGMGAGVTNVKRKAAQEPPAWFDLNPEQNTKVYVSNLPLDITLDEFAEVMSKCGMIMRDPQTQKIKLKLYTEADGQIKGDGLCDYIKVESVDLALKILDEYVLRGHKIRVQRAQFQMRGEYNPALKPKRKKKDKEKLQKMKEKLFDWRPEKLRGERSKNEKIVIIKNLFSPEIFEKEVQLILEYQNDLREECGKCGTVRKVIIYDLHPEGVAQINMSCPEEADLVIKMMHGRYFGQRLLTADHWDGKTKYKISETETAVKSRLNNWDSFLESDAEKKQQQETVQEVEK